MGIAGIARGRGIHSASVRRSTLTIAGENGNVEAWEMHEWFDDFLDACNRHDLDVIRAFLAPTVRRAHLPGVDAWIHDLDELFRAFPDWRWRRIHLVAEDDRIAAHLRAGGTQTGAFRGIAATRRHVNVAEFAIYRLAAGRVVEATGSEPVELFDQLR